MFPGTLSSLPTAKVSLRLLLLPVMLLGRRPTTTRRRVWMKEVSDIVWASAVPAMAAALGLNKDSSKPLKRQVSFKTRERSVTTRVRRKVTFTVTANATANRRNSV